MFLTGFLILFLLLIIYLLLIPIVLFIDTATNQYYFQLQGLAKVSIESHKEELLRIKLKIFFLKFYFYPLKNVDLSNRKKKVKEDEKKNSKKSSKGIGIMKSLRILKSFKVKRLFIDVDTGDWVLNAKLYPFYALFNSNSVKFNINFLGRNQMALHMFSRPIYIIKSFINF